MIKKTFHYLWSVRHQFAKYFVIGFSGVCIDMITLILFKEVFGWIPVVAVTVNQAILVIYIFILNKYWSFKNRALPHTQFIRYLLLAGFNYGFSVLLMYIFSQKLGFDYRIVRIISIMCMVSWNFFLYKYWVYKEDKNSI